MLNLSDFPNVNLRLDSRCSRTHNAHIMYRLCWALKSESDSAYKIFLYILNNIWCSSHPGRNNFRFMNYDDLILMTEPHSLELLMYPLNWVIQNLFYLFWIVCICQHILGRIFHFVTDSTCHSDVRQVSSSNSTFNMRDVYVNGVS